MTDTQLNPDTLAYARSVAFDCWESGGDMDDLVECAIEAYLAVAQPVVNSAEAWEEGWSTGWGDAWDNAKTTSTKVTTSNNPYKETE